MTRARTNTRMGRLRRRLPGDRGSTSVEMIGYTTVWLLGLLIAVQAAVWGLAQLACMYAANHALQATRVQGGTAAAGQADAATVLAQVNTNLVAGPGTRASRDAATATVTVNGTALQVIPFLRLPVGSTVSGPVETLS